MLANTTKTSLQYVKAKAALGVAALALASVFPSMTTAQTISQPRLASSAGQPLLVNAVISSLTPEDSTALKVKIADQSQWDSVGLKPPVGIGSMTVRLGPGRGNPKRDIQITSPEAIDTAAVDLLLEVTTASSNQVIQLSFIVGGVMKAPTLPKVDDVQTTNSAPKLSSPASGSASVKQGDTLFAIAQNHAVPGTSIYQMLLALFQANPNAFIDQNMNLLKAGVTLEIPDAAAVKSIDPQLARNTFAEQVRAFNTMRGRPTAAKPQKLTPSNTQSGSVQAPETVQPPAPKGEDKVSLSNQTKEDAAADARATAEKQRQEEQARLDALQQNIKQLKEAAAPAAPVPSTGESTPLAAGEAAKPVEATAKVADTAPAKEEQTKNSFDYQALSAWVLGNLILTIAGVLGLIAIIIAWAMRAAGMRNDLDAEDDEVSSQVEYAVASYFKHGERGGHSTVAGGHTPPDGGGGAPVVDSAREAATKAAVTDKLSKIDLDLKVSEHDGAVTLNVPADKAPIRTTK